MIVVDQSLDGFMRLMIFGVRVIPGIGVPG
jgi:hypothetical protein